MSLSYDVHDEIMNGQSRSSDLQQSKCPEMRRSQEAR